MKEDRKIKGKRVLVTGGAGFIGSNLIEVLLRQDNEVVCLDDFSTGKRQNIAPFLNHPDFTLIEGDIRNPEVCRQAVQGAEIVLHQAALGSVPRSIHDPLTTNQVNIDGFLNMLIAARDAGVGRFIYAASSSTYGDHPGLPKVEERTGRPLSPYAVTKYVNELYAGVFYRTYGLDTIGLRYFNVFGRRQDPEGAYAAVIPRFIGRMLRGEAPVINGDGSHSRDFTHIDNVIQLNQLAATTNDPGALNQVYNGACGASVTLNELVAVLKELLAPYHPAIATMEPVYGPERPGDIRHSLADVGKARKLLGYNPQVDFATGIRMTIGWYVANLRPEGAE